MSITSSIECACLPHKMKTMFSNLEETISIVFFVKISHPKSLWEFALSFSTVKTVFKSKTPWSAHDCKFPELGTGIFNNPDVYDDTKIKQRTFDTTTIGQDNNLGQGDFVFETLYNTDQTAPKLEDRIQIQYGQTIINTIIIIKKTKAKV